MTLLEFILKYYDQKNVGDTLENTGQCVGLIETWTDLLGLVHTWGNAKDLLVNADTGVFDVVQNTPTNIPLPGDIFVFGKNYGGGLGHTGIVVAASVNIVSLFEQNDPKGATPRLKTYIYGGPNDALGWLHPKNFNAIDSSVIDSLKKERDAQKELYLSEVKKNNELATTNETNQKTIIDLKSEISKISQEDKDYAEEALKAEHATQDVITDRKSIYDALSVSTTKDALDKISLLQKPHTELVNYVSKMFDYFFSQFVYKRVPKYKSFLERILAWIKK